MKLYEIYFTVLGVVVTLLTVGTLIFVVILVTTEANTCQGKYMKSKYSKVKSPNYQNCLVQRITKRFELMF